MYYNTVRRRFRAGTRRKGCAMTPKYEVIHQTILRQIDSGALRADEKLPGEDELAREYGVSLITVRRAMTELVSDGVIRRVRGQGSYVKQRPVPKKQPSEEKVIAFLLNHDNNAAVSITRIITGVQDVLSRRGYRLLAEWNVVSGPVEKSAIDRMIANRVDGFIIYPFDPDADTDNYEYIEKRGLPYVVLDRYPHGRPCAYVGSDNFAGGMAACGALLRYGHKNIAMITNFGFLSSEQERMAGFLLAAREAGSEVQAAVIDGAKREELPSLIRRSGVTGLFCVSDRVAARTIQLLTVKGLRVPEDVSVIGFDDCFFDSSVNLQFASVRQDFRSIGCLSAEKLLELIDGKSVFPGTKTLLPVELVERRTSLGELGPKQKTK